MIICSKNNNSKSKESETKWVHVEHNNYIKKTKNRSIYFVVMKKKCTFAPDLVRGGSNKTGHNVLRPAEKPV